MKLGFCSKALADWQSYLAPIPLVNWRKMHNLKVVSWILFGDHTGDYSLGHSLSAWRNFSKEVREEPGYMEIFGWKKKNHAIKHQNIANHKEQISQINVLVLFCLWESARIWAHWNYPLHGHLNCLGPVSKAQNSSGFFPSWVLHAPLGVPWGVCGGVCSDWWLDICRSGMMDNSLCLLEWQLSLSTRPS